MIFIEPKFTEYKKKDGKEEYKLLFHLNNKEKIEADKMLSDIRDGKEVSDYNEFCYNVCLLALKNIEGFKGYSAENLKDADFKEGLLNCSELIDISDINKLALEVRGLGKLAEAMKKKENLTPEKNSLKNTSEDIS